MASLIHVSELLHRWGAGEGEERDGEERTGKGKTNPCRGERRERGRLRPLSHRQTAINKSIGNCGWLENGWGWEDGKERDLNQSSSKMDGARKGMEKARRRDG